MTANLKLLYDNKKVLVSNLFQVTNSKNDLSVFKTNYEKEQLNIEITLLTSKFGRLFKNILIKHCKH